MDIEKEIELLEILQNTPMPPDPAPVPASRNGIVEVPFLIREYFEKIKVKLDMDEKGQMKAEDYSQLLDDYHIPTHGIKMIRFVVVTRDDFKEKK